MFKLISKGSPGWFAAGVAAAALLIPAAVGASTVLIVAGTVGISGGSTFPNASNHADVSQAGQILTTSATPHFYYLLESGFGGSLVHEIAAPPKGSALVVTSIHLDANPSGGVPETFTTWVGKQGCGGSPLLRVDRVVTAVDGETVLPYEPGVAIPSGTSLCGELDGGVTSAGVGDSTVVGYTVPAASVLAPG